MEVWNHLDYLGPQEKLILLFRYTDIERPNLISHSALKSLEQEFRQKNTQNQAGLETGFDSEKKTKHKLEVENSWNAKRTC